MLVVKFCLENKDIRRITVENPSLEELKSLALSLFREALPHDFLFKYTDPDNDEISITCDRELEEAFRLFSDNGSLRLRIVSLQPLRSSNPPPAANPAATIPEEKAKSKSALDEVMDAVTPFLQDMEARMREILPKLEEQAQNILPRLESLLPKLDEILPKLEEKLKETFVPQTDRPVEVPKDGFKEETVVESPKPATKEEIPKPAESAKPAESPKPVEIPKPVESSKPVEIPKPAEELPKPAEIPKPAPPPKEKTVLPPFESKLAQLEEMGFLNRAKNIEALVKRNGDMILVTVDLLE